MLVGMFASLFLVTIIKDKETRTSKGFGYLLFRSEEEATKALKELDGRVRVIVDLYLKGNVNLSSSGS